MNNKDIEKTLFDLAEADYKNFNKKLLPTVDDSLILGVRTPTLRKLAKELYKNKDTEDFLNTLPHKYYEENNLHAFIIEQIKDYDEVIDRLNIFLPFVDNWATCDCLSPAVFKKNKEKLLIEIKKWLKDSHTYTVRFAIGMLMRHYLDDSFDKEYVDWVIGIKSDEYYINMMISWYLATAIAKQPDTILPIIESKTLPKFVQNKTVQKSIESFRVPKETKDYLRTLKI